MARGWQVAGQGNVKKAGYLDIDILLRSPRGQITKRHCPARYSCKPAALILRRNFLAADWLRGFTSQAVPSEPQLSNQENAQNKAIS